MAMLTVMMVLLMLTVLGIAAITASGLGNNMAGLQRTMEASANAAESCLGTGANIIQQVLLPENADQVPAALLDNFTPPGPVPNSNKTVLENEFMGKLDGRADRTERGSESSNDRRSLRSSRRYRSFIHETTEWKWESNV
jgi:Tfp pilus assembly protein PilX